MLTANLEKPRRNPKPDKPSLYHALINGKVRLLTWEVLEAMQVSGKRVENVYKLDAAEVRVIRKWNKKRRKV